MAAITAIYRFTGAGPSAASVAGGVLFTRDDSNSGTTPLPIPAVGAVLTNFTFPAVLALRVVTNTGSAISNKRLYQSGSMPTGMQLFHNTESTSVVTTTVYAQQTTYVAQASTKTNVAPSTAWIAMTTNTAGTVYDSTGAGVAISSDNTTAGKYVLVVLGADGDATQTGNVTLATINLIYDEQ